MADAGVPVPDAVPALAAGLRRILGPRLVAVYLGGSLAMGDFSPASSDFDVLVVTEGDLLPDDLRAITELHEQLLREYPDAARLEGDYAPRQKLIPEGTTVPVPGFGDGQLQTEVAEVMLSADNLANMHQHGIAVYGPPASEVLPPVAPDHVREAVRAMLAEGAPPCATEQEAASELLNLLRSYCALESGEPATKSLGAAWGLARLGAQWHAVIRRAAAVRGGAAVAQDDLTLQRALPALDQYLRARSALHERPL